MQTSNEAAAAAIQESTHPFGVPTLPASGGRVVAVAAPHGAAGFAMTHTELDDHVESFMRMVYDFDKASTGTLLIEVLDAAIRTQFRLAVLSMPPRVIQD